MKIIDETERQKKQRQKITKGTKAIVKGSELNDFLNKLKIFCWSNLLFSYMHENYIKIL